MALDLVSIAQPHYIPGFVLITNLLSKHKIYPVLEILSFIFIDFMLL